MIERLPAADRPVLSAPLKKLLNEMEEET